MTDGIWRWKPIQGPTWGALDVNLPPLGISQVPPDPGPERLSDSDGIDPRAHESCTGPFLEAPLILCPWAPLYIAPSPVTGPEQNGSEASSATIGHYQTILICGEKLKN